MTTEEVDSFLQNAFCGRTATIGSDGYPYIAPNLFVWYGGTVYLHTGRHPGHFAANVRHCDRVSFEADEAETFFTRFMTKYAPADSWGREIGSFPRIPATIVYAITPD